MMSRVEAARSILARPGQVALEVDGQAIDVEQLTLTDQDGTPAADVCAGSRPGSRGRAGRRRGAPSRHPPGRPGLRRPAGGPDAHPGRCPGPAGSGGLRVLRAGAPRRRPRRGLRAADDRVAARWSTVRGRPARAHDAAEFRSAEHQLNAGLLRSAAEHATDCHQEELGHALASRTRTAPQDVIAVQLDALTPRSVELVWVDRAGAHRTTLTFPRRVRDPSELAATRRSRLGVGAC